MNPFDTPHEFVPGKKHPQWCAAMSGDVVVADNEHGKITMSTGCGYREESHTSHIGEIVRDPITHQTRDVMPVRKIHPGT